MYVAYSEDDYNGITVLSPIGVFKNKEDMIKFKEISPVGINYEEIQFIDPKKIEPIRYIDFVYNKDGSHGYTDYITNTFLTKDDKLLNKAYILNGNLHIVKTLDKDEDEEETYKNLSKIAPKILLSKEIDELNDSENNGVRINNLYVKVEVSDLLKMI